MSLSRLAVSGAFVLALLSAQGQPGSLDTTFDPGAGANGEVMSLGLQSDGRLIIGGTFTSYNGTNQSRVARVNPDGSLDTGFAVGTGANSDVSQMSVLSDDRIVLFGKFLAFNGTNRSRIARLNTDGSLDPAFMASYGSYDSIVAIQSDGRVVTTSSSSDGSYYSIVRLGTNGCLDSTFVQTTYVDEGVPLGRPWYFPGAIQADGRVLIGGDTLKRLHAHGSDDRGFAPTYSSNPGVTRFAFQRDGKILVAGTFTNLLSTARPNLARLNVDGSMDLSFDPGLGPNGTLMAVQVLSDGKVLVAGNFTTFNGTARCRIARLNADGSVDTAFDPGVGPDAQVDALAVTADGRIVIAGQFANVSGVSRARIARLNGDPPSAPSFVTPPASQVTMAGRTPLLFATVAGDQPLSYQWRYQGADIPGATNPALSLPNVQLTNAGEYTLLASNALDTIISTGATLSVQRAWVYPGSADISACTSSGPNSCVSAMAVRTNGKIVIGGLFTQVNGVARSRLAQINPDGSLDASFDAGAGPNDAVNALAVQADGKLLIGGRFTNVNGTVRKRIARINANGSLDTTFSPPAGLDQAPAHTPTICALAVRTNGEVLVGGDFSAANGSTRNALAWLLPGGVLTSFNANFAAGTVVRSLLIQSDGKILVGGMNASGAGFVKRYRTDGLLDWTGSVSPSGGSVLAMAQQADGKILTSGWSSLAVVRLNDNGTTDTTFNLPWVGLPPPGPLAVQSDGRIVIGGVFRAIGGIRREAVARLNSNGTVDPSFDTSAGVDGTVSCLAVLSDGKVLVGGGFANVNGCERHCLALLNGDLRILSAKREGNNFSATVKTDSAKNYILEFKDSLADSTWTPLPTVPGDGTIKDLTDPAASGPQRFYRVRVE